MDRPTKIEDLNEAPYNPRVISDENFKALKRSLSEFGDISGIVWNKQTGQLVAGHQRLRALKEQWGNVLKIEGEAVCTPDGQKFDIRVVDWDNEKEVAANIAANSPLLAGEFTDDLDALVESIGNSNPELMDALRLDEIGITVEDVDGVDDNKPVKDALPAMELQPFEHYDYVLILARNTQDWEYLCEKLQLQRVNASPIAGKKKIGLGRAIPAEKLIKILESKK